MEFPVQNSPSVVLAHNPPSLSNATRRCQRCCLVLSSLKSAVFPVAFASLAALGIIYKTTYISETAARTMVVSLSGILFIEHTFSLRSDTCPKIIGKAIMAFTALIASKESKNTDKLGSALLTSLGISSLFFLIDGAYIYYRNRKERSEIETALLLSSEINNEPLEELKIEEVEKTKETDLEMAHVPPNEPPLRLEIGERV